MKKSLHLATHFLICAKKTLEKSNKRDTKTERGIEKRKQEITKKFNKILTAVIITDIKIS